jgi:hypothetical protein
VQVKPQTVPSHVGVALVGAEHGEHDTPQVVTLVLLTHAPPQAWKPASQA